MTTKSEFKINKAKVSLQLGNPFFSYLSLFLKISPDKKGELPEFAGGGVNIRGELIYKEDWIEKLGDKQVATFLAHEILHLAFNHLTRLGSRDMEMFNVANDLIVNNTLQESGFELIERGLNPYNNVFEFKDGERVVYTLRDINKKFSESIYDELMKNLPKEYKKKMFGNGKGRFDNHEYGKGMGVGEREETEELWKKRLEEASTFGKMRGKLPSGVELYLDKLKGGKINWRALLEKYIQNSIPSDDTWLKRGKKSRACGFYLPSQIKEKIEVSIAIDTSGSICKSDLTMFIDEIVGLAKAYKERADMRVIVADCEIGKDYIIENGNIEKIKKMDILGGGGTDFNVVIKYIKEKNIKNKLLIFFTDGYGTDIDKVNYDILWVLTKNGDDTIPKKYGKVIKMLE